MDGSRLAETHAELFATAQTLPDGEWGVIDADLPGRFQLHYRPSGGRDLQLRIADGDGKIVLRCDWMGYDLGLHYGVFAVRPDERAPVAKSVLLFDASTGTVRLTFQEISGVQLARFTLNDCIPSRSSPSIMQSNA